MKKKEIVKWETLNFNHEIFQKFKMLVVETDLYGVKYNFSIDTGANENIIDEKIDKELYDRIWIPDVEQDDGFFITGIGDDIAKSNLRKITITVANMNESMMANVLNLDNINRFFQNDIYIAGIIGNIFIKKASWIIDFHRLTIWYPMIYDDKE